MPINKESPPSSSEGVTRPEVGVLCRKHDFKKGSEATKASGDGGRLAKWRRHDD